MNIVSNNCLRFCVAPNGDDVEILGLEASETGSSGEEDSGSTESSGAGQRHCHFHAGVPYVTTIPDSINIMKSQ